MMFECGWGGWMVGWSEGLRAGLEVASTDGMSERETRARDRRDAGPWCESNDFTLQILALWIRQQRRGDCKKRQKVQLFRFSLRHLYSSLRVELPVLSETQQLYIMGQRDERTKVAEFTSKCNSISCNSKLRWQKCYVLTRKMDIVFSSTRSSGFFVAYVGL